MLHGHHVAWASDFDLQSTIMINILRNEFQNHSTSIVISRGFKNDISFFSFSFNVALILNDN